MISNFDGRIEADLVAEGAEVDRVLVPHVVRHHVVVAERGLERSKTRLAFKCPDSKPQTLGVPLLKKFS